MADSYENLRIKITADTKDVEKIKQSARDIEQVNKAVVRSLIAQDNEYRAIQKSNLEKSKVSEKDWANYVKTQSKQVADSKIQESKRVTSQLTKDAELIRKTEQRRLESVFRPLSSPDLKGQSVTLNSLEALQQQKKHFSDLLRTMETGSSVFNQTKVHLDNINEKIKETSKSTIPASFNIRNFIGTIRDITIAGYALSQVLSFLWTSFKGAADLSVYKEKFNSLAGGVEEATKQLELLRVASTGNLNDSELVKYSNKMRLLGFTSAETTQLLDIVERKADDVGVSFEEGNSALQKFILTGSGRSLKELGINVNEVKRVVDTLTKATGKTTDELEGEEQEAIRLKAVLQLYGDTLDNIKNKQKDVGDSANSLSTDWDNLKDTIGEGIVTFYNWLKAADQYIAKQNEISQKNNPNIFSDTPEEIFQKKLDDVDNDKTLTGADLPLNNKVANPHFKFRNEDVVAKELEFAKAKTKASLSITEYNQNLAKEIPLEKELATFTKDRSIKPPRVKKEIEDQLYTLDKYLSLLKAQTGLNDENYKQHLISKDVYTKESQELLTQLNSKKSLVSVVETKHKTAEEIISAQLENQTKFLREQLDLAEKISKIGQGRVTSSRRVNGEDSQRDKSENYFQGQFGFSNAQPTATGFDKSNADQVIKVLVNAIKESIETAQTPFDAFKELSSYIGQILSDTQNIFSILGIGTKTFASEIIQAFDTTLGLINSVVSAIHTIGEISSSGIVGTVLSGIGSFFGLRGSPNGNIGNLSSTGSHRQNINVNFGNMRLQLRGQDLYGTLNAYTTQLNQERY